MRRTLAVAAFIAAVPLSASPFGGWFGPSNYEECILEKMKGITSDVAAREVKNACRVKFSQPISDSSAEHHSFRMSLWDSSNSDMSSDGREVLGKLQFQASEKNDNRRILRFHNGSRVRIDSVRLGIVSAPKKADKSPSKCPTEKIDYKDIVNISFFGGVLPESDGEIPICNPCSATVRLSYTGIEESLLKQNSVCIVGFETGRYSDESELKARIKRR